jgi:hypothetical protein
MRLAFVLRSIPTSAAEISNRLLEPVRDLDQGMQRKAKVDEKAQHTLSM